MTKQNNSLEKNVNAQDFSEIEENLIKLINSKSLEDTKFGISILKTYLSQEEINEWKFKKLKYIKGIEWEKIYSNQLEKDIEFSGVWLESIVVSKSLYKLNTFNAKDYHKTRICILMKTKNNLALEDFVSILSAKNEADLRFGIKLAHNSLSYEELKKLRIMLNPEKQDLQEGEDRNKWFMDQFNPMELQIWRTFHWLEGSDKIIIL